MAGMLSAVQNRPATAGPAVGRPGKQKNRQWLRYISTKQTAVELNHQHPWHMLYDIRCKRLLPQHPLGHPEYMRMSIKLIPQPIINQYQLTEKVKNGCVYMQIDKGMYGLLIAGHIANELLARRLAEEGYFELPHTPGLWKHASRPVYFSLVADDFGTKYEGRQHAQHLTDTLQ